jgi:hypothetical protein
MENRMMHDDDALALEQYPGVIATLIRQRTLKIAKQTLRAKGVWIGHVTQADLERLARAYFESHSAECVRVAIDTIRVADGLRQLAEAEARRRAKKPKDITPARHLITHKG